MRTQFQSGRQFMSESSFLLMIMMIGFFMMGAMVLGESVEQCKGEIPSRTSCHFQQVCLLDGKVYFNTTDRATKKRLDGTDLVVLGTYDSHPMLQVIPKTPTELANLIGQRRVSWVENPTILYCSPASMYYHWLMDDTLGLYWIIQNYHLDPAELKIILQNQPSDLYKHWMGVFTEFQPRKMDSYGDEVLCFRNMFAGPSGQQFGGAGRIQLKEGLIGEMKQHILRKLDIPRNERRLETPMITVLKRTTDRLMLNGDELVAVLSQIPHVTVQYVALEKLSFRDQLTLLAQTTVLIGVHGSGMTNVLFLPPGAAAVEIFPYKMQRRSYEDISGLIGVQYSFWQNPDVKKTRFHPEILDNMSVSESDQAEIKAAPIFTKSWAANLYWVNQDTVVDSQALKTLIQTKSLRSPLNQEIRKRQKAEKKAGSSAPAHSTDEL